VAAAQLSCARAAARVVLRQALVLPDLAPQSRLAACSWLTFVTFGLLTCCQLL